MPPVVIDTRPSFSLLTEMALLAATDAIVPVEPRYLETVGLMSVIGKINDIREGWRHPQLRISGILVTKMDSRIRGHNHLLDELKAHSCPRQTAASASSPPMKPCPTPIISIKASSPTVRNRQPAKPTLRSSVRSCAIWRKAVRNADF